MPNSLRCSESISSCTWNRLPSKYLRFNDKTSSYSAWNSSLFAVLIRRFSNWMYVLKSCWSRQLVCNVGYAIHSFIVNFPVVWNIPKSYVVLSSSSITLGNPYVAWLFCNDACNDVLKLSLCLKEKNSKSQCKKRYSNVCICYCTSWIRIFSSLFLYLCKHVLKFL